MEGGKNEITEETKVEVFDVASTKPADKGNASVDLFEQLIKNVGEQQEKTKEQQKKIDKIDSLVHLGFFILEVMVGAIVVAVVIGMISVYVGWTQYIAIFNDLDAKIYNVNSRIDSFNNGRKDLQEIKDCVEKFGYAHPSCFK